uniref:Uncharacterized protein n=1 Tax=Cucumis melo TaxID=3656 RepID=A0A9I9EBB1_CUCME
MKEVGANSDIHWVLFDEENRAIGFMRIHKSVSMELGSIFGMVGKLIQFTITDKLKGSCACDSESCSVSRFSMKAPSKMIYEIFINYMTEILSLILSLRLEITVDIEFLVSLGLLVKSVNYESRQIQVKKSVVRRLHTTFRSKLAGSPEGGVTLYASKRFRNQHAYAMRWT